MIEEKSKKDVHGFVTLPIFIGLALAAVWGLISMAQADNTVGVIASVIVLVVAIVGLTGHYVVNPNEGEVLQLFGDYVVQKIKYISTHIANNAPTPMAKMERAGWICTDKLDMDKLIFMH